MDPKIEEFLYYYKALIVAVYDGDTVTCNIDLGFGMVMHDQKLRLLSLNAPEMRGDDVAGGIAARDALRSLILDKWVLIRTKRDEAEKFGRWLATIYLRDEAGETMDVNQWMIGNFHAESYLADA